MIGQGMQDDHGVLARLDDFIQIADGPLTHGAGKRAILPDGTVMANKETPDQVAGRQIIVASDRDQWPVQFPGHMFDEAGLATAGRPFEHDRQATRMAALEHRDFIAARYVERLPLTCFRQWRVFGQRHVGCTSLSASTGSVSSRTKRGV